MMRRPLEWTRRVLASVRADKRTTKILKGSSWVMFASLFSAFSRVILVVILTRHFSKDEFGVWAAVTSFTAIITMGDLGVTNSLRNKVSVLIASLEDGLEEARKYYLAAFYSFLTVTVLLSIIVILYGVGPFHIASLFKTDDISLREAGTTSIVIAIVSTLLGMPFGLAAGTFFSFHESRFYAIIVLLQGVLSVFVVYLLVKVGASFIQIAFFYFVSMVFPYVCGTMIFLYRRKWYNPRLEFREVIPRVKALLGTGVRFLSLQLSSGFLQNVATILTSSLVGLGVAAEYNLVQKLYGFAVGTYQSTFNTLWAGYAEATAKRDWTWLRKTFRRSVVLTFAVFASFTVLMVLFGNEALVVLGGPKYHVSRALPAMVGGIFLFYVLWACVTTLQNSMTKLTLLNITTLVMAGIVLIVSKVAAASLDLYGILSTLLLVWLVLFVIHSFEAVVIMRHMETETHENH